MTQTTGPLTVRLTYRAPGRLRVALAVVAFAASAALAALSSSILTAGLLKVESVS